MGVSFKIAKVGSRYRPKPQPLPPDSSVVVAAGDRDSGGGTADEAAAKRSDQSKVNLLWLGDGFAGPSANCEEPQASFSLYLFPDGFSVGKPTEGMLLPLLEDAPESLHPYDRQSAIEYGWLPGDVFDDIPCKYSNGTITCEVWDYRTCLSKVDDNESLKDEFPKVQKICLRMGMENVVKDLPLIVDDSWNYKDLLEVESRITKALQPDLFLSPIPSLDRLCRMPFPKQLELGICEGRFARKHQGVSEINFNSTSESYTKDISRNGSFDSSIPEIHLRDGEVSSNDHPMPAILPNVQQDDTNHVSALTLPIALSMNCNSPLSSMNYNSPLSSFSPAPNKIKVKVASIPVLAPDHNLRETSSGLKDSNFLPEKRDRCELQFMHEPSSKRKKQEAPVSNYCQYFPSNTVNQFEKEIQKNITSSEKQVGAEVMVHPRIVGLQYPQSKISGAIIGLASKPETRMPSPIFQAQGRVNLFKAGDEVDKVDHVLDIESAKTSQQCDIDKYSKCSKKANTSRKMKSNQSLLVSSGNSVHCPISKLGDNHRISSGVPKSTCTDTTGLHIQGVNDAPVVNASVRNKQMPPNTKKKPKSHAKITNQGCKGLPANGSNSSVQLCSNSSPMGVAFAQPIAGCRCDPCILQRFSKIITLSNRPGPRNKKNANDEYHTSGSPFHIPPGTLLAVLEQSNDYGTLMDKLCMSKFLIDGNRNINKIRMMSFVRERYLRGNNTPVAVCDFCKLVLFESEKPDDKKVWAEMIFGEDSIPFSPLPSPHHADLFAAQFTSLMKREGYMLKIDQILPTVDFARDTEPSRAAPNSAHTQKQLTSSGSQISILNQSNQCSPQDIFYPTIIRPSFLNLTRPNHAEMSAHENLLVSSIMRMSFQLPNNSVNLHPLQFQQYQERQRQQLENILPRKTCGIGMEKCVLSGSGQSHDQYIKEGNPKVHQTSIKSLADEAVGMDGDRPLLNQLDSPNLPPEHSNKKNSARQKKKKNAETKTRKIM